MKTIIFTGGGTGGHIYPGLAVVDELRTLIEEEKSEKVEFIWIGSNNGLDKQLVEKSGSVDKFIGISSGKLRRYFSFKNFIDFFKIGFGFLQAFFTLSKIKPVAIFSKGGFVSVPPCYAGKLLKIPVYTHECDFSTGLATRLNMKVAKKLFVSYEETKNTLGYEIQKKTIVTGNPVRPVFYTADSKRGNIFLFNVEKKQEKPVLLILGGSLGAKQINELVWDNIDWLTENFVVVHQTGKKQEYFREITHKDYYPHEFIYSQMSDVMASTDIVFSRAGANFLWESLVENKPLILLPLAGAGTRGDQVENAKYFESKGCAFCLSSDESLTESMKQSLLSLKDEMTRKKMMNLQKILFLNEKPAKVIARILFEDNIK